VWCANRRRSHEHSGVALAAGSEGRSPSMRAIVLTGMSPGRLSSSTAHDRSAKVAERVPARSDEEGPT
jgi:hypothetical protein